MPTLGIHKDFMKEFALLERPVQKRVAEAFEKFEHSSFAGQHLEKLERARDPRIRTIRITQFHRGVVLAPESGDCYLLLRVMPHDDAIAWALKQRASVNTATSGIEIRDDVALERAATGLAAVAGDGGQPPLFAGVSDADLRRLGIDDTILPLARHITSVDLLDSLQNVLPEHQYDVLMGLATGMTPEEVYRETVQNRPTTGPDTTAATAGVPVGRPADAFATAMARSQDRIALVSGPAELMDLLERPFDAWRVFLHPSQHRIAHRPSYNGPARVTGGPGTGKTVVALHRAAGLAARLPEDTPDGAVLLTTFTRDLAAELERSLDLLVTDPAQRRLIRVANVDALANQVVREHRGTARLGVLTDHREITTRWGRVTRRLDLDLTDVFLDQEWRHVVLAQDLTSAEEYLRAPRPGRGRALGPLKRAQVWRAVASFTEELRREGLWTFLQICAEAARILDERAAGGTGRPFRHVVVDEAQDLHPAQWRLLRAAVAPGPDDLFIAGDTHQRIYGNKVSLRSLGITVTGRSSRLRINYRTTQEILRWSTALLTGTRVDDMDDGQEHLTGYRSVFHGEGPEVAGFATKAAEIEALVARIAAWRKAGVAPEEIGVCARFVQLGRDAAEALRRAGIPAVVLGAEAAGPDREGVRIGTMHRMKGLEFRCTAVLGVGEGTVPMRNALTPVEVDPLQHQEDLLGELSLLFVACTRAREALSVTWHGNPSPFLAPALEPAQAARG
ncbi:AAA family ATPase [Streptacidiphilus sp. ASG 303]|uniref:UvrD-helicase domain-containing protein n=1 Tax=Streptacidiphilus sp. ASG 303 TaxID=2896847 RepID=UPI001E476046|nr:UvrD-helicase domain-containing protein [Streptacidiphilus sp. ASG 303]MCD0485994.1 AAA family ATPase [Streptacidiphilus sp. ASG 303]